MVVAHGETAVAKRARHLCGGTAREKEREREKSRRKRDITEVDQGWCSIGQWLGGIWVKRSQPDRRKRGDCRVMWLKRKGASQTGGNGY